MNNSYCIVYNFMTTTDSSEDRGLVLWSQLCSIDEARMLASKIREEIMKKGKGGYYYMQNYNIFPIIL